MAIGLKYGKGENGSNEDKETAYDWSVHFISEFKKTHKSVVCRELLDNIDMKTAEGMSKLIEMGVFKNRCPNFVKDAVKIAEKIIK